MIRISERAVAMQTKFVTNPPEPMGKRKRKRAERTQEKNLRGSREQKLDEYTRKKMGNELSTKAKCSRKPSGW